VEIDEDFVGFKELVADKTQAFLGFRQNYAKRSYRLLSNFIMAPQVGLKAVLAFIGFSKDIQHENLGVMRVLISISQRLIAYNLDQETIDAVVEKLRYILRDLRVMNVEPKHIPYFIDSISTKLHRPTIDRTVINRLIEETAYAINGKIKDVSIDVSGMDDNRVIKAQYTFKGKRDRCCLPAAGEDEYTQEFRVSIERQELEHLSSSGTGVERADDEDDDGDNWWRQRGGACGRGVYLNKGPHEGEMTQDAYQRFKEAISNGKTLCITLDDFCTRFKIKINESDIGFLPVFYLLEQDEPLKIPALWYENRDYYQVAGKFGMDSVYFPSNMDVLPKKLIQRTVDQEIARVHGNAYPEELAKSGEKIAKDVYKEVAKQGKIAKGSWLSFGWLSAMFRRTRTVPREEELSDTDADQPAYEPKGLVTSDVDDELVDHPVFELCSRGLSLLEGTEPDIDAAQEIYDKAHAVVKEAKVDVSILEDKLKLLKAKAHELNMALTRVRKEKKKNQKANRSTFLGKFQSDLEAAKDLPAVHEILLTVPSEFSNFPEVRQAREAYEKEIEKISARIDAIEPEVNRGSLLDLDPIDEMLDRVGNIYPVIGDQLPHQQLSQRITELMSRVKTEAKEITSDFIPAGIIRSKVTDGGTNIAQELKNLTSKFRIQKIRGNVYVLRSLIQFIMDEFIDIEKIIEADLDYFKPYSEIVLTCLETIKDYIPEEHVELCAQLKEKASEVQQSLRRKRRDIVKVGLALQRIRREDLSMSDRLMKIAELISESQGDWDAWEMALSLFHEYFESAWPYLTTALEMINFSRATKTLKGKELENYIREYIKEKDRENSVYKNEADADNRKRACKSLCIRIEAAIDNSSQNLTTLQLASELYQEDPCESTEQKKIRPYLERMFNNLWISNADPNIGFKPSPEFIQDQMNRTLSIIRDRRGMNERLKEAKRDLFQLKRDAAKEKNKGRFGNVSDDDILLISSFIRENPETVLRYNSYEPSSLVPEVTLTVNVDYFVDGALRTPRKFIVAYKSDDELNIIFSPGLLRWFQRKYNTPYLFIKT